METLADAAKRLLGEIEQRTRERKTPGSEPLAGGAGVHLPGVSYRYPGGRAADAKVTRVHSAANDDEGIDW